MYISIHRCCSVLCWTTFGRSCSLKCFWVWLYKLGTSIFRQSFTLFFAKPLKLQHVIVGIVSTQLFSDLSRDVWSGNRHSQSGPLCGQSFINLAVCLRSLSWWKMSLCPVRGPECSEHCCTLLYSPKNYDAATRMVHCRECTGQVTGAWFPSSMTLCIQAKEFNFSFIRPENFISYDLRLLQMPFGKLQGGCHVHFTEEWLLPGPSTVQAI